MNTIRTAVFGAGHLGRIHCRLLADVDHVELLGVVDPHPGSRKAAAQDLAIPTFASYSECADRIDAAIVATPTVHHHAVAMNLLADGVHVFIEKPLAVSTAEANEMVDAADAGSLVLQAGHSERFNPAFQVAQAEIASPRLIEARRCGPYTFRSTDVGVVFDLMVHDIDLVLQLVDGARLTNLMASGGSVFGPNEDWAEARLTFENGCLANLSVSRVSPDAQRTMRVHGDHEYAVLDFADGSARVIRPATNLHELDAESLTLAEKRALQERLFTELLPIEQPPASAWNAILEEQRDFIAAIQDNRPPQVTGKHARDAVEIAARAVELIERSHRQPLRKVG